MLIYIGQNVKLEERVRGDDPLLRDWKSLVLPLHHTRNFLSGEAQSRTEIYCFSDSRRDHLGYLA